MRSKRATFLPRVKRIGFGDRIPGLARDEQGAAGLEFSILASVLVLLFVGSIEIFDANRASNRARDASAIIADLTSRMTTMTDAQRDALFAAGDALVGDPASGGALKITISSIATTGDGGGGQETDIVWSETNSGAPLGSLADLQLPTIPIGESVIIVQTELDYRFIFRLLSTDMFFLGGEDVRRPRFSHQVIYTDD